MTKHTQECETATRRAQDVVFDSNAYMTKAEADRYEAAIESCPAEHPWH